MMASRNSTSGKKRSVPKGPPKAAPVHEPNFSSIPIWLNGDEVAWDRAGLHKSKFLSRASQARIVALVKALQDAGRLLKEEFDKNNKWDFGAGEPKSVWDALDVANKLLDTYKQTPCADFGGAGFDPAKGIGEDGLHHLVIGYATVSTRPAEENIAASMIIELVRHKKFYLLRQCVVCSTWFLASRSDQVTCSVRCRDKVYRQTEEYKTKQRELMRKIYHQKKQAKQK